MQFDIAHELKEALETDSPEVVTPIYGLQTLQVRVYWHSVSQNFGLR